MKTGEAMEPPQLAIGAWYVGFHGPVTPRVVDRLSPPGWQHCLCFGFHAQSNRWLVYDVTERRTLIFALSPADFPTWLAAMKINRGLRVLRVEPQDNGPTLWTRFGLYCVTAVKHIVGSRSRALRPIDLWRDLLAAGAVEAFTGQTHAEEEADAA